MVKKSHLVLMFTALCVNSIYSNPIFAQLVNLYYEPNAKLIGTIDPQHGIIPIFQSKDKVWIKVANPKDGSIGWVKQTDLQATKTFAISQAVIYSDAAAPPSKIIAYATPATADQQAIFKQLHEEQQAMQHWFHHMESSFFEPSPFFFPMILPVMVVHTPATHNNTPPKS